VLLLLLLCCCCCCRCCCRCCCCSEDYNWWWRSYFTSGSSALYLFAYSAFYFYSKLDITKVSQQIRVTEQLLVLGDSVAAAVARCGSSLATSHAGIC
jgi:transmembrane 9 superfamily protein 2/4